MSEPEHDTTMDDWWPLRVISEKLGVSKDQLHEWNRRRESTDFPEAKAKLGRYELFDLAEVRRWLFLWRRATDGVGRGQELNGD